jgi:HK97 gp10 family phage protein
LPRSPKLTVKGDKALIKKLKRLGDRRQLRKVLRRATTAAAQVVVKAVRKQWPTDSGLSKRSVTKKVIKTKSGFSAVIGVDKDAEGAKPDGTPHVPSNIDHLIEFGFQHPNGTTVPARAPLRKGYDASKADAERRFIEKATQEIEREATRR